MLYKKKICMLGVYGVGKSSMVRRYVHDLFEDTYMSTIGVKVMEKLLPPLPNPSGTYTQQHFLLWDIEGQEESSEPNENYLFGASGAMIVCDLTRKDTLKQLDSLIAVFLRVVPQAEIVLVGNKKDLYDQKLDTIPLFDKIAKAHKKQYFITSAKSGENVENAFLKLAELIAQKL